MSSTLALSAYDLSDEGPGRRVNEDVTLVRDDLGLFVVADGAGGKGRGDVAATLAARTIENYIGATVRQAHDRPDYDRLGNPEQAKRLSRAVHRAHQNLRETIQNAPEREGMATTVVAALLAPRTGHLHVAHVGDSRCYRIRHGRLELLTEDHSLATDVLERQPDLPDEVLEKLPKNSVVRAVGMNMELRVSIRSVHLQPGDRFLLCTDGVTTVLPFDKIWRLLREAAPPSVIASELLSHALAAGSRDNVSLVVIDCEEVPVNDELPTRPYNRAPPSSRSLGALPRALSHELEEDEDFGPPPSSFGPEIATEGFLQAFTDWPAAPSARTDWPEESEPPPPPLDDALVLDPPEEPSGVEVTADFLVEPAIEIPPRTFSELPTRPQDLPKGPEASASNRNALPPAPDEEAPDEEAPDEEAPPPSYTLESEDLELESLDPSDIEEALEHAPDFDDEPRRR